MHVDIHEADANGDVLTLLKPVKIHFRGKSFVVPAGFGWDGVSTKPIIWASVSPPIDPRSFRGGMAHDFIYRTQPNDWPRFLADLMFLVFLIEDGLGVWKSLKAYAGVRIRGWHAWNENKKKLEGVNGNHS